MKILITGGAGYFGSVLSRRLLSRGHEVVIYDNLMYGGNSLLDIFVHPHLSFINADIRSAVDVESAVKDCDAVVHLAAIVGDPACKRNKIKTYKVNVVGSEILFEACSKNGVEKVIFASTCSNYGKMDRSKSEYVDENSPLIPVSAYAKYKVQVENLLSTYKNLNPVILRFATLHGISPRMRFDLTVNQFAMEAVVDKKLLVYGPQFYRPYLHVLDASSVVQRILELPVGFTGGQIWNVGDTTENYTKGDIIERIKFLLPNIDLEVSIVQQEDDPRDYKVSFDRIRNFLNFESVFKIDFSIVNIAKLVELGVVRAPKSDKWRN